MASLLHTVVDAAPGNAVIARHRHSTPYAAIVLDGGYEEAGDQGRINTTSGDVVLHAAFEAHLNRFARTGAKILNLKLPPWFVPSAPVGRTSELDKVVRLARHDPTEAALVLLTTLKPSPRHGADWPDMLAADIAHREPFKLAWWAREYGISAETVSRGFRAVFGVGPAAFRAEARARAAWLRICTSDTPLAEIAAGLSFSDQSHMTRAVAQLTGSTPAGWRRFASKKFKTGDTRPH